MTFSNDMIITPVNAWGRGGGGGERKTSLEEKNRDFYKILGIKKGATDKEVKKAFKKKSIEAHPDKNKDDD